MQQAFIVPWYHRYCTVNELVHVLIALFLCRNTIATISHGRSFNTQTITIYQIITDCRQRTCNYMFTNIHVIWEHAQSQVNKICSERCSVHCTKQGEKAESVEFTLPRFGPRLKAQNSVNGQKTQ